MISSRQIERSDKLSGLRQTAKDAVGFRLHATCLWQPSNSIRAPRRSCATPPPTLQERFRLRNYAATRSPSGRPRRLQASSPSHARCRSTSPCSRGSGDRCTPGTTTRPRVPEPGHVCFRELKETYVVGKHSPILQSMDRQRVVAQRCSRQINQMTMMREDHDLPALGESRQR